MATHEEIEKVRQGIMRFRELLDLMQQRLSEGEEAYSHLFSGCSPEDIRNMKTKDLQWLAAETLADNPAVLRQAALIQRGNARELERAFEELHDNFVTS